MAPPKRKGGGRVTPKGTQPGSTVRKVVRPAADGSEPVHAHSASTRYTPPVPKEFKESPRWVPVLMGVLLVGGALTIMLSYLAFDGSGWLLVGGLVAILAGILLATQWR